MPLDITANRHGGSAASEAAFLLSNADHPAVYQQILGLLVANPSGLTSKEIGFALNRSINTFSGRLTELKLDGKAAGTGKRREGAEVIVAVTGETR